MRADRCEGVRIVCFGKVDRNGSATVRRPRYRLIFPNSIAVIESKPVAYVFGIMLCLLAATPLLALGVGWLGPQLIGVGSAAMLMLLPSASETDVRRCITIFKPLLPTALLATAWMAFQLVPISTESIAHPIWRSAAAALADGLSGHISIDLGPTLRAIFSVLNLAALLFSTAVLTRGRDRAEIILLSLCIITTFIALVLIALRSLASLTPLSEARPAFGAITALGVILNATFALRALQHHETRAQDEPRQARKYMYQAAMGLFAALLCLLALALSAHHTVLMAAAVGLIILALVFSIRRLNLSPGTATAVAATAFVAYCSLIALQFAGNTDDNPLLQFSHPESADAGAAVSRMLSDTRWSGTGIGSYRALAGIYRDAAGLPGPIPVNTITSIVLEWGYVGTLLIAGLLLQLLIVLLRGALSRGRDSFYASGAAACVLAVTLQTFCDASLTEVSVQVLTAITIGLGLSQTVGLRA